MARRFLVQLVTLVLLLSAIVATPAAAAESAAVPTSMAAVGDSITQAASTGGSLGADYPQNSWSTGTNATVNSHFLRLRAQSPNLVAHNRSVSGAKVADLPGQMQGVVGIAPDPGYLTVLIGGNDLCTDTVAEMTSVDAFRAHFTTAMQTITSGSPSTYVYVTSIPDVYQLWKLFKGSWWARFVWSSADICQSLLANPTSTQPTDEQRRLAVRERNMAYNTVLAEVCAAYGSRCHFDGHAVFGTEFTKNDVSGDYFHPSIAGQAKLASVSWDVGYSWAPSPPSNQAPTAAIAVPDGCTTDVACTGFSGAGSSDPDGDALTYSWEFGDGTTATGAAPTHTYTSSAGSPYTVSLTVSDGTVTDVVTASVTVSGPEPPPTRLQLTVSAYKIRGVQHADLAWSGTTAFQVDVYRDGSVIATTANDGAHTDNVGQKGGGTHTYRVCEAGTTTCSDVVSVSY